MTSVGDIRMPSLPEKDTKEWSQWHSIIGDAKKVLRCPECTRPVIKLVICNMCTHKLNNKRVKKMNGK